MNSKLKTGEDSSSYNPFVSVIIPLYNGRRYIEECLRSVLSQTYNNYEIIVVNDASTDGSIDIVKNLAKDFLGRIRIISHDDELNHGIAASRNLGIREAKGEYIAFLDQDDIWLDRRLEKQVKILRRYPGTTLVYAQTFFIDEKGEITLRGKHYSTGGRGYGKKPQNVFYKIIRENFIPTLTVLVKKESLQEYGCFEEGPRHEYEDWLLWSKIAYKEEFLFIPEALTKYRLHGNNFSLTRLNLNLGTEAEEHYFTSLLEFLRDKLVIPAGRFWLIFIICIIRLFMRGRSWGLSREDLKKSKSNILVHFRQQSVIINTFFWIAIISPHKLMYVFRRLRRILIRI